MRVSSIGGIVCRVVILQPPENPTTHLHFALSKAFLQSCGAFTQ